MIDIDEVAFLYPGGGGNSGIRNISLNIRKGEVVLLCGESGCGKTSVTRLMNGLIPNFYEGELKGCVRLIGINPAERPVHETGKYVGSVFQNPRTQFFNVDTTSELVFGCENRGLPRQEILLRLEETVSDFSIEPLVDRNIFRLSGGEKQKIACASVSALKTDVIVLDEPSSNLDINAVEDLRRMISVWKKQGRTVVVAEHRLYYLRELIDRVVYMKDGSINSIFPIKEFINLNPSDLSGMGLRPLYLESIDVKEKAEKKGTGLISLSGFRYSYDGKQNAIDINQLDLPSGSIIAVVGDNGAGKTTFARCLCGLNRKFKGVLRTENRVYKGKNLLKCCYMVMQDVNHQLFAESVLDEVLLGMKHKDLQRAEEILSELDLFSVKEVHPVALSGGQKQRVAVAGAVASDKDIIIFDEPTSGLDLRHMKEVSLIIEKLAEQGKTVVIISHDLEFIAESCEYVIQMKKGRIRDYYPMDNRGISKLKNQFIGNEMVCSSV